jgi:hypothetical protein
MTLHAWEATVGIAAFIAAIWIVFLAIWVGMAELRDRRRKP